MSKWTWWQPAKTETEHTLTNETDQLPRDKGNAYELYEEMLKRDPKRAAKLLEQFEREAVNQWQSSNS